MSGHSKWSKVKRFKGAIDAKRLSCPKNSTNVWEKRPPANSEIDHKNRADITVGPVVKN